MFDEAEEALTSDAWPRPEEATDVEVFRISTRNSFSPAPHRQGWHYRVCGDIRPIVEGNRAPMEGDMNAEESKRLVRGFVEQVLNTRNLDAAGDYMAEDVVEQVPFPGQGRGLAGLKDVLRGLFAAFPDMHWTIEEQIAEVGKVLTRFIWTGTHKGEFFGVPATGREVSVWGMVIDRVENGRIRDTRILMDALGLMRQLGA